MLNFEKKDINLINDVWAFLSVCECGYLVDDAFSISSKKELAGWLLYESQRSSLLDFGMMPIYGNKQFL